MSTSRDALAARIAGGAARRTSTKPDQRGQDAIRTKPVRITLDLDPETYRALNRWISQAAVTVNPDLPRLSQSRALRAMVRATIGDTAATGAVIDELRKERRRP
jgi:hypothetical protein